MELKNYIEAGIEMAGGTGALAKLLDVQPNQITDAKGMRQKLPIAACYMLAELLQKDAREITAASELVTEKRPERRAVFLKYLCTPEGIDNPSVTVFRS